MLTLTVTRKKALRVMAIVLAVFVGVGMGIMMILSAMTASASAGKLPIYSVSRGDKKIAVTFDCAWGNTNTDALLKILKDANVAATFFVTGEFCDKYPEDVKKFFDAGHEIANHSDMHPHVEGMNINDLIADTRECSRKIEMITGEKPVLYRAPYGEYNDNVITTIEGMGLKMIQWSVDSIDWQEPDAATIQSRIIGGTESGSILLFHNDLENTTSALPEIFKQLSLNGYAFSKVSDLIYWDDYYIDNAGKQIYQEASQTVVYSDNQLINQVFAKMRDVLTTEEIMTLSQGADPAIIEKLTPLFSEEQIWAVENASYEVLKAAMDTLVAVVEVDGAGGDAAGTSDTSAQNTTAEESTAADTDLIETDAVDTTPPPAEPQTEETVDTLEEDTTAATDEIK